MRKNVSLAVLTAVVTNVLWFAVVGCVLWFGSRPTTMVEPLTKGEGHFVLMNPVGTQDLVFVFQEAGPTPTNSVGTNYLQVSRALHDSQDFRIVVRRSLTKEGVK